MAEKLTGYKKKMAMLGQKMIAEEQKSEIKSSVDKNEAKDNKSMNVKFT